MKISVNRGRCVGNGFCEAISPEHFEVGDDGVMVVLRESFPDQERALIEQAVRACPARALSIVGDDG